MRAYIKTYGCTLNQADSQIIRSVLTDGGVQLTDDLAEADIAIINTCTVKKQTEQRIRHTLGMLSSSSKLIVTGCMAGANPDIIAKAAPGASIVTQQNLHRIADAAVQTANGTRVMLDRYSKNDRLELFKPSGNVIAKIGVSDGCLSACSFCETRFARGPLNSSSEHSIISAVRQSVRQGAREIQITAQDIGAYGADTHTDIARLMQQISAIDGDFSVRIGMLNPEHLGRYIAQFAEALNNDKFYKFVHLPVQSGSNRVLTNMGRRYAVEAFEEQVEYLRKRVAGISIETDIIVGYPTETEHDFEQTMKLVSEIRPDMTNISSFTQRPHAPASKLGMLDNQAVKRRTIELSRHVRHIQKQNNAKLIGTAMDFVVTELTAASYNGKSKSYKQVVAKRHDVPHAARLGDRITAQVYAASANALYVKAV